MYCESMRITVIPPNRVYSMIRTLGGSSATARQSKVAITAASTAREPIRVMVNPASLAVDVPKIQKKITP